MVEPHEAVPNQVIEGSRNLSTARSARSSDAAELGIRRVDEKRQHLSTELIGSRSGDSHLLHRSMNLGVTPSKRRLGA